MLLLSRSLILTHLLENEPASVTAIASAILQSNPHDSGLNSPFNITDDDAARSCKSSASSFGTSPSSGSFASAFSHGSGGSFGSFQQRGRRRRRRRTVPKDVNEKGGLNAPPKTFQCTFCTVGAFDISSMTSWTVSLFHDIATSTHHANYEMCRNLSGRNMTGRDTKNLYIYHWKDGFAVPKAPVQPSPIPNKRAAYFAAL